MPERPSTAQQTQALQSGTTSFSSVRSIVQNVPRSKYWFDEVQRGEALRIVQLVDVDVEAFVYEIKLSQHMLEATPAQISIRETRYVQRVERSIVDACHGVCAIKSKGAIGTQQHARSAAVTLDGAGEVNSGVAV